MSAAETTDDMLQPADMRQQMKEEQVEEGAPSAAATAVDQGADKIESQLMVTNRSKRKRKSTLMTVDGQHVLKLNNYTMEGGEPSIAAWREAHRPRKCIAIMRLSHRYYRVLLLPQGSTCLCASSTGAWGIDRPLITMHNLYLPTYFCAHGRLYCHAPVIVAGAAAVGGGAVVGGRKA